MIRFNHLGIFGPIRNPGYTGVLVHDPQGRMLLATAVGLQILGLIAIKKITTVKV